MACKADVVIEWMSPIPIPTSNNPGFAAILKPSLPLHGPSHMRHLSVPKKETAYWREELSRLGFLEKSHGIHDLNQFRGIPLNDKCPSDFSTKYEISNTHSLGQVLYTDYIHVFQISGMILLIAMIGAIVLTFRKREGVKTQSYIKQISRERSEGVEVLEVSSNKGVKIDD